jgi:hypothetical protein
MSDPREYFNTCPLIKVKLPMKIPSNEIKTILDYIEQNSNLNLIRLNRGFRLANPKREILFSEAKYGFVKTLDVYHNEIHFDPEIEGLHLAIIIRMVKQFIIQNYAMETEMINKQKNENEIYVKLYHDPIHEKLISRVITRSDTSDFENIRKIKNGFILNNMKFKFRKPKNNHVYYIKCTVQNYLLIDLEEEKNINRIRTLVWYAYMTIKQSNEIVDSSDSE